MRIKLNKILPGSTAIIILLLLFPSAFNLAAQPAEYNIKAVFLERFTRFIDWPENTEINDPDKPFIIGVIGDNPFGSILEEVYANQKIKNKKVEIIYINDINRISGCQMLFISGSKENELNNILSYTRNKPIITVGDTRNFAESGVLINFFLEKNHIRFEINESAVKKTGLIMSYHLLKAAKIINLAGRENENN